MAVRRRSINFIPTTTASPRPFVSTTQMHRRLTRERDDRQICQTVMEYNQPMLKRLHVFFTFVPILPPAVLHETQNENGSVVGLDGRRDRCSNHAPQLGACVTSVQNPD